MPDHTCNELRGGRPDLASFFTTGMSPSARTRISRTAFSGDGTGPILCFGQAISFSVNGTRPMTSDVAANCCFLTSGELSNTQSAHHQHAVFSVGPLMSKKSRGHFVNGEYMSDEWQTSLRFKVLPGATSIESGKSRTRTALILG